MPADPLADQLLTPDETSPATRTNGRKKVVSAIALGLLFTAGFVGYTGQPDFDRVPEEPAPLPTSPKVEENFVVPFTATCYAYTGGTCVVNPCNADRHATCSVGKCLCEQESCTDITGNCQKGLYKQLTDSPITLTNIYWPSYMMYMPKVSITGAIQVERSFMAMKGGQSSWWIYELPGLVDGKKQYFLASAYYANFVAARSAATIGLHGGLYAYNLDRPNLPYDPQGLTVYICSLTKQGYRNAIMIGGEDSVGKVHWAYIDRTSWKIKMTSIADDPGEGGYWQLDKEIEGLDDC